MCTQVTRIIPELDNQMGISGCILQEASTHPGNIYISSVLEIFFLWLVSLQGLGADIVDSEKNKFEKFRFESAPSSTFETCNKLWKMLES